MVSAAIKKFVRAAEVKGTHVIVCGLQGEPARVLDSMSVAPLRAASLADALERARTL